MMLPQVMGVGVSLYVVCVPHVGCAAGGLKVIPCKFLLVGNVTDPELLIVSVLAAYAT